MINLLTFFKNHFDSDRISNDNMVKFTQSHIQRLTANNPANIYDTLIADTTTAFTTFGSILSEEDTSFSTQQALTLQVDDLFEEFKSMVSQKEGLVRATWGKVSPQYIEFFPSGLTEYANATKANIEILMQRVVVKATKYETEIGTPFLTLFTDLQTNYVAARTAQLAGIGDVAGDKTSVHETRLALATQLMTNLLTIAVNHIGDPDRGMDYFDQSIIRPNSSSTIDEGELFTGEVPATTTQAIIKNSNPDMTLVIANTGTRPLTFSASSTPDTPGTRSLTVAPGDTLTQSIDQITPDAQEGWAFVVTNPETETLGTYSVERLP